MSLLGDRLRRLTRLFVIVNLLQSGSRVTLADLAAACGCCTKTIQRDLTYLNEAGVAYVYDPALHSYTLLSPVPLLTVQFSVEGTMAPALAKEAVVGQSGTPFEGAVHTAFEKVMALLPPAFRQELAEVPQFILFQSDTRRDYGAAPWKTLLAAARARETVEMDYFVLSRNEMTIRKVDPYCLTLRKGYWELVGFCHLRQEVRLFALDGIRSLRLTDQTFCMPKDFSLAEFMRGSVGVLRGDLTEIAVRFEPSVARWARRRKWEFPHTLTEEPDGTLMLRGTVSGLLEIQRELMQWGAGATVLEPSSLRAALLAKAQAIAAKYE